MAEPKALRYWLLHVAARLTHGKRRAHLRLPASWPWARDLAAAFAALAREFGTPALGLKHKQPGTARHPRTFGRHRPPRRLVWLPLRKPKPAARLRTSPTAKIKRLLKDQG